MMPARPHIKTAYYLRSTHQGNLVDLESHLRRSRAVLSTVASTEIDLNGEILRLQALAQQQSLIILHIVRYIPGEQALTLRPKQTAAADTEHPHQPPHGMEYKDGDAYLLVSKWHVIFCSHGISQAKAKHYVSEFLSAGGVGHDERQFRFTPAANATHLDLIRRHGVKAIRLSAGAYLASANSHTPTGWVGKTLAQLDQLAAPFKKDQTADEIKAMENLIVKLELNLDGNTRAVDESKDYIATVAEAILNDTDEIEGEISIVTRNGETINADHVRLQKRLSVRRLGKNLDRDDLAEQMIRYFDELAKSGLLEK